MYLLLLVFGGVLTAAGILLGASGVSIHDRTFDTTIVTPGVVAAVGGLLLIGLGLALRVLQRIEQAIALRRTVPLEGAREPAAIPLPKPTLHPVTAPAVAASVGEKHVEKLPEAAPALARLESSRVAEEAELSVAPVTEPALPTSVDVAVAEAEKTRTAKRKNGALPARLAPRLDVNPRSPGASERPAGPSFDALWPKGQRPLQVAVAPAEEPETSFKPAAATVQTLAPDAEAAPEPVSVLKSGVVDGMAYTLYSDGSIEAQLPQGMLRFGSITELRNHIEQSA
ncbi:MAG: hypothetical protein CR217_18910 [Beijerinckiaceae bacterium]|jgi:hypothetical protein|nr:MAG: hypothetical protein CR217_18910 [Beijerinckiaceae bacterium]